MERKRESFGILYILSRVKIKRERETINKIEIDAHIFVKWNQLIKLGRFRQKQHEWTGQKSIISWSPKVKPRTFGDFQNTNLKMSQLYKNRFCGLVVIPEVIDNIRSKHGTFDHGLWQNTELGVCKKHLMHITLLLIQFWLFRHIKIYHG